MVCNTQQCTLLVTRFTELTQLPITSYDSVQDIVTRTPEKHVPPSDLQTCLGAPPCQEWLRTCTLAQGLQAPAIYGAADCTSDNIMQFAPCACSTIVQRRSASVPPEQQRHMRGRFQAADASLDEGLSGVGNRTRLWPG